MCVVLLVPAVLSWGTVDLKAERERQRVYNAWSGGPWYPMEYIILSTKNESSGRQKERKRTDKGWGSGRWGS